MSELEEIRASNLAKVEELKQHGQALSPEGILLLRINALIEFLIPEVDRDAFELVFEEAIEASLLEVMETARTTSARARLLQGIPGFPSDQTIR